MEMTAMEFEQLINMLSDISMGIYWVFIVEVFFVGVVVASIIAETLNRGA